MTLKSVLEKKKKELRPSEKEKGYLKKITGRFVSALRSELTKTDYGATVFVGGSYAKGTILKKYDYDIDINVRFPWQYDRLTPLLDKPLKNVAKALGLKIEKVHGSRDYFRCYVKDEGHYFEVVPVTRIRKPHEERNVTDLSYFHVSYVKDKIKGLEDEVRLAKTFMHAQGVYGAESYIQGFSGYAVECLIIYYKGFVKMLKGLSKIKLGEREVIDLEKHYKRKQDVFFDMNENKLQSPIILVDPTYKERNALASLSQETLERLQDKAKAFLKKPSESFFKEQGIDFKALQALAKKKKAELLKLRISTDRQPGDIAGTKLKKFFEFLKRELKKYFKILESEFSYGQGQSSEGYLVLLSRQEVVRIGPPVRMQKHVKEFEKEHERTFEKNGFIHASMKVNFSAKAFLDSWMKGNKRVMDEMGITGMDV